MGREIYEGDLVISWLGGYTARIGILYNHGNPKFSGIECKYHLDPSFLSWNNSRTQTHYVNKVSGSVLLWDNPSDLDRELQARLKAKYVK